MYFVIVYTDHSRGLFRQLLSAHMAWRFVRRTSHQ